MIINDHLFLKKIKELVSNPISLLDTLRNGGMTGLELIEQLHRLEKVLIRQKVFGLLLCVEFVPDLVHHLLKFVNAERLFEDPHFLKVVCVRWRLNNENEN